MPVDPLKEQSDALIGECMKEAMTPAQKQKAYRERHKDRVREADRLRKRRKRD